MGKARLMILLFMVMFLSVLCTLGIVIGITWAIEVLSKGR